MGTEHNQLNQILDSVTEPHIRHFDMSGVKQVEMDCKKRDACVCPFMRVDASSHLCHRQIISLVSPIQIKRWRSSS